MAQPKTRRSTAKQNAQAAAANAATHVHPAWIAWVAENLAEGAAHAQLSCELAASAPDLSLARATEIVAEIARNPLLAPLRDLQRKYAQREAALCLLASHAQAAERVVARKPAPSGAEFYQVHYALNAPAIFTDFTAGWKARAWSPSYLLEHLGDSEMEIASGRSKNPRAERYLDPLRERTTMAAYVDRVLAAGSSDDIYTVANNHNMDRAAFARLLEDVEFRADYFNPAHLKGGTAFWFGPAGTTTGLHHDTTNILFHQFYGRKRFVLAAPYATDLLRSADGFYNNADPDSADFPSNVQLHELVLEPGETLFLPAGWWHKVTALDVSISFSQLNLRLRNNFEEYQPGRRE